MLCLGRIDILEIKLSGNRYEEIKLEVVNMFQKYDISCVPISGFEIAKKMGVKVIPYSAYKAPIRNLLLKESEDGFFVERTKGDLFIYYNDEKDYGRINNTIMHEIGHIVLNHSEDSELAEKEVRFFAKYALVPPVLVHKFKIDNPNDIVDIFQVSFEAARYAYSYYQKWLEYGDDNYTDYEEKTLQLFKDAV